MQNIKLRAAVDDRANREKTRMKTKTRGQ